MAPYDAEAKGHGTRWSAAPATSGSLAISPMAQFPTAYNTQMAVYNHTALLTLMKTVMPTPLLKADLGMTWMMRLATLRTEPS